ncbi:hypothetical protein SAMN04488038_101257 [Solimonas aquatica]|uniref:Uncharacterized protein n=1 Tax=Solimonas aquatica TaxID=489703 RepID=A0A1H9A533_9GAMM|nr:hypothetical protein [Solimonas aquatica]SEP71098.1 hypothetical protein SAMN04488038_101257 [Solimonas aquatica]
MDEMTKAFTERIQAQLRKIEAAHTAINGQDADADALDSARLATEKALAEIELFVRDSLPGAAQ